MQTLLLLRVTFGLLIQRSLARLLDDRCGMAVNRRILNGRNAEPEAAAWMAGVRNETQFLCGGTLIHKRFVLTAAHCIEGHGRLFVKLGAYNLSLPAVEYSVSHAETHWGYSRETVQHDIGLLKLPLDVVYTAQIYPICIKLHPTTQRKAQAASTYDAYGWGKTQAGQLSEILQRVTLDHYNRSRCNNILYSPLTSNQICAGSLNRDTCFGDSGGPLIKELNYNGIRRLTQLGIVSYGLITCTGLGVYTNVARYAEWIEEKIKAPFPQSPSSFAAVIANPVSISPPSETVASGAENFNRTRLLVEPCGTAVTNLMDCFCLSGFVLTSGYCASTDYDLFVKLGSYDLDHPTMEYNVTKKIVHDKFDQIKGTNDIALLQLSHDILFSRFVHPICIILNPEVKLKVENANTFDAYGWGEQNFGRTTSALQKVTLDRYNRSVCWNRLRVPLISSQICAGAPGGDTCRGDGGGPLTKSVLVNGHQRQTQFGVISVGSLGCEGIGIYTDVTSYVDWIVRNVRGY